MIRGKYLVDGVNGCFGCHSDLDWSKPGAPPVAGHEGSGHIWSDQMMPWLIAPNITPDQDTGIGHWTTEEFVSAVRDGRGHNGTRLYPAMPYPAYTKMSDDDVLALRSYFLTIAPVHNPVVANQLPFPFNIRLSMLFWNAVNFSPGRFQPVSLPTISLPRPSPNPLSARPLCAFA